MNALIDAIKSEGHDGLIIDAGNGVTEYAVFDAKQIVQKASSKNALRKP